VPFYRTPKSVDCVGCPRNWWGFLEKLLYIHRVRVPKGIWKRWIGALLESQILGEPNVLLGRAGSTINLIVD